MRIAIDIGGTFTDVVVLEDSEVLRSWKVQSTPQNFEEGVLNGIELAAEELSLSLHEFLGNITHFIHGTTVTTNLVLTRSGERVGLITSDGFGDTYELARQYRGHEQDPAKVTHPAPLVPRQNIEEVTERIDFSGRVVAPLNDAQLVESVRRLLKKGIRSFAVCFLWSYVNPEHEKRAKRAILDEDPDVYVSASYEVCPVAGEYERTSTSVINAYCGPALKRYALRLNQRLRELGLSRPVLIMKSDGGPASIEGAATSAVQTLYSGPAAGVVASEFLGGQIGERNLITFDMGGTSTDVALVYDGEIQTTSSQFFERHAVATPMIDLTSVGAGGGSLGWAGMGDTLQVGPQSAGAMPGPACYGNGGSEPTVTDANVALGLIDPEYFLGGRIDLDSNLAERAIAELGQKLQLTMTETAVGMYRVVNAVMADAIRLRTVFKGFDPRDFTLVSFGGAGGLHCAAVAGELQISRIVIPRMASVFSAAGLLASDITYSFVQSATIEAGKGGTVSSESLASINEIFAGLDTRVKGELDTHEVASSERVLSHAIEVSYLGQILNFEITAPMKVLDQQDIKKLVEDFDERYIKIYGPGAAAPETGYTLKTYKVVGIGKIGLSHFKAVAPDHAGEKLSPKGERVALADTDTGEMRSIPIYDGNQLSVGAEFAGPAVAEFWNTSVLVPNGWSARVDERSDIILQRQ